MEHSWFPSSKESELLDHHAAEPFAVDGSIEPLKEAAGAQRQGGTKAGITGVDEVLEAEEQDARKAGQVLAPGLYLVATPIGNLEDITLRALRVLRSVDRIACEDTRQTQKLMNRFGIRTPTVSYHMHNEGSRAEELTQELKAGGRIAVVSDAGTPGIADPGGQIAASAIAAAYPSSPVPGANAAVSALIAEWSPVGPVYFSRVSSGKGRCAENRLGVDAARRSNECLL